MGILRIQGAIDINQFWPNGTSDADTVKIKLHPKKDSFEFKPDGENKFTKTMVFYSAISRGQGSKPVISKNKKDSSETITIRLQGIDAPELHFRAAPLNKKNGANAKTRKEYNSNNQERRQYFGESAALALGNYLVQFADKKGILTCTFETVVDYPYEVVDTYGRFIGDIIVGKGENVNLWLIRNGWAFPTFYTSMSVEEMKAVLSEWEMGKKIINRIGKMVSVDASKFDWNLSYDRPPVKKSFNIGMTTD
jgi:endonuclease YncB( thermonuclease family)